MKKPSSKYRLVQELIKLVTALVVLANKILEFLDMASNYQYQEILDEQVGI